jgi:hypothetical protein
MAGYSVEMNRDEVIEELKQKAPIDPHAVASPEPIGLGAPSPTLTSLCRDHQLSNSQLMLTLLLTFPDPSNLSIPTFSNSTMPR